jgi:hypothetical protein
LLTTWSRESDGLALDGDGAFESSAMSLGAVIGKAKTSGAIPAQMVRVIFIWVNPSLNGGLQVRDNLIAQPQAIAKRWLCEASLRLPSTESAHPS